MMMMGMGRVSSSSFNSLQTVIPSMTGIMNRLIVDSHQGLEVDGEVIDAIAVADVGGMCYQIDDTGINAG